MKCPKCNSDKVHEDKDYSSVFRCMNCNKVGYKLEFKK